MIYINKKVRITGEVNNIQFEFYKTIENKKDKTKRKDWVSCGNYTCVEHALNAYYELYQNSKVKSDEELPLKQFLKDCAEFKSQLNDMLISNNIKDLSNMELCEEIKKAEKHLNKLNVEKRKRKREKDSRRIVTLEEMRDDRNSSILEK